MSDDEKKPPSPFDQVYGYQYGRGNSQAAPKMTREQAVKVAQLVSKLAEMHADRATGRLENQLTDWDGSPSTSISDIERVTAELADELVGGRVG